ncbi:aldehyde dehydrogenase [Pseudenhygromyxa sp. WMMC2535]|uniref:aldehyde dehydrogenase family protein n=1 Tax=Pseudenhygromyxa sp. WMMC2535 TaxID=2712867 RepID=UPI001553EE44|nr:aldehyde dehydrogenase family protein [Pseudenhygromyxa sp. WMMC2535]NVB43174.1 aldehyde dehydrogenase [Pseudenhygromyxa sp. WMMC2535]
MAVIETRNPATGEPLPPVEATQPEQLAKIIADARAAQREWAARDFEDRAAFAEQLIARVSDAEIVDELARSVAQEMGKPLRQARAEIANVRNRSRAFVDRAREACKAEVGVEGSIEVTTTWRPLGVVAVIAPWNFPVSTPNNLALSAILTGNAAVLKPSEFTPRSGALYHALIADLLPPGLLGLVQGGGEIGRALVQAEVDMVAFTGSIATGQAIMREAAGGMKRLVLELGGKDPMLILPGANVDAAADFAVRNSLTNCGQVCVATERVFVHRDLEAEFIAAVRERVAGYSVGDPLSEDTDYGPMASERQREIVLEQLADARERGAEFVVEGQKRGPGYWLGPSVVRGVADDMRLAREETFGPVVAISTFAETDEAVRRANATPYGLGASVWGPPGPETEAVAGRLEAGMVGINRGLSAAAGAPWVGWKMSGYGYTRSVAGMRNFMQPQTHARNVG